MSAFTHVTLRSCHLKRSTQNCTFSAECGDRWVEFLVCVGIQSPTLFEKSTTKQQQGWHWQKEVCDDINITRVAGVRLFDCFSGNINIHSAR